MNAAKQAVWLFCALIALAYSGWYFVSSEALIKLDDNTLANTTDTMVMGLTVRQFNTEGMLVNFLESSELQHIPNNNTNLLTSPHIIVTQKSQPSWTIRSKTARTIHGGDQITFIENVIIHQDQSTNNAESTFKTEELTYFNKQKFATTSKEVVFEQPGSIIHSNGMNAYLADKRVELLGKARATYQPNRA